MDQWEMEIENEIKLRETKKASFSPNVCPRTFGETCKMCELTGISFNEFYKNVQASLLPEYKRNLTGILWTKKPGSNKKADWLYPEEIREMAKTMKHVDYYYANVTFPKSIDPNKVYILEFTSSIFNYLLDAMKNKDSDYYGFWDAQTGTNICVTKSIDTERKMNLYKAQFRRFPSALPDPNVLRQAYQLTPDLIIQAKTNTESGISLFPQKELQEGDTEIRILPFDAEHPRKFFIKVMYHYGISEGEYKQVLAGTYNPYEELYAQIKSTPEAMVYQGQAPASNYVPTPPLPADPKPSAAMMPIKCFGSDLFDEKDPDCSGSCKFFIDCKVKVEEQKLHGNGKKWFEPKPEQQDIPL